MNNSIAHIAFLILVGLWIVSPPASAQTGDALIDSYLSGFTSRGGNSLAPNLGPSSYPNGILNACNSASAPSWEGNCPSDLMYTPNANTGGYQAFGVGINNWPGGTYYYPYCYPVIVWYQDELGWYYQIEIWCDWYYVTMPTHTYGVASARIKFGSLPVNGPWGSTPMSTLAFKGNAVHPPYVGSATCTPIFTGMSAPCVGQSNVIAVPDAGYEDKILIPDSGCNPTLGRRSGDASDASAGCFVLDGTMWATDLPSPYPDTTFLDEAPLYVASMGSANPRNIAENTTYTWWINFFQYGLESPTAKTITHNSAVTVNIPSAPGCSGSALWNCYFNVDQTTIAPQAQVLP
jgi:hypothetical protein